MDLIYTLKLQICIHESLMFYKTQDLISYSMARQTSICKVGKRNLRQLHGASKQGKIKNYKEEERELPNLECLFNENWALQHLSPYHSSQSHANKKKI